MVVDGSCFEDMGPANIDWDAELNAVKLRRTWIFAAIHDATSGTQFGHRMQLKDFQNNILLQLTCTDSSLHRVADRVAFWSSIWSSLISSECVSTPIDISAKEALDTAKSVVTCTDLRLPNSIDSPKDIVDAAGDSSVASQPSADVCTSPHTSLPHSHLLMCVPALVQSKRPDRLVIGMGVANRIFEAKHELCIDNFNRYDSEMNVENIAINNSTGQLIATSELMPDKPCLPFFGEMIIGHCKDIPWLALGGLGGVKLSMCPPGCADGLPCPKWKVALRNEEADTNCKLGKYQVNV